MSYEEIEHTADVRIRSSAASLVDLFCQAAADLTAYMFGAPGGDDGGELVEEEVRLGAPDKESLFVDWLSEILFRSITSYRAYVRFDIHSFDGETLVATIAGRRATAVKDVKAVTYSQLRLEQVGGRWESEITYDI